MTIYTGRCRRIAADMFERGLGRDAVARALGITPGTVRKWHETFRAVDGEALLSMGRKKSYDWGPRWSRRAPWSIWAGEA